MYAFGIPPDYGGGSTSTTTPHTNTIHCHELLREACGIHHCDRRRTKTQLQHTWGHIIQFSHDQNDEEMSDPDTLWSPTHRETIYELQCRISQFMTRLLSSSTRSQPSKQSYHQDTTNHKNTIIYVLVTHGVWMETMLQMYDPTWSSHHIVTNGVSGPRRIHNADIYSAECIYTTSTTTAAADVATSTNTPLNNTVYNIRLQNVRQISTPYGAR